jgi:FKBP-type peptidyl-prolyl cis-trans isomerase FkpA
MNKKRLLILTFLVASIQLISCLKSNNNNGNTPNNCITSPTGVPTALEIASLKAYLKADSLTTPYDARGFFYKIITPGTGVTPSLSSTVTVKYIGTLENGTEFDRNNIPNGNVFQLSGLIKGWQYGIPLIKKGGSIKLFLPPTLAYGCNFSGGIPPGSNLIFTVDLVDVQ